MRIQIPTARPDFSGWRPGLPYPDDSDLLAWYWSVAQQLRPNPVCVEIGVSHGRSLLFLASRLLAGGHGPCPLRRRSVGNPAAHRGRRRDGR